MVKDEGDRETNFTGNKDDKDFDGEKVGCEYKQIIVYNKKKIYIFLQLYH